MPDEVQPTGEGQSGDLYDLSSVPEDVRGHVEPILKEIQANVTPRFQEAAEFRKTWEPYSELGITDLSPDQMKELLDFARMTNDRDAMVNWIREIAPQFDLRFAEEDDDLDLDEIEGGGLTREDVSELIQEALNPVQETLTTEQQERATAKAMDSINEVMNALEKEHGEFNRDAVAQLAAQYAEADPDNCIQRGFDDYQAIRGEGEKGLFEEKAAQPSTPEGAGGTPDTSPTPVGTIEEAGQRLREKLRASQAA